MEWGNREESKKKWVQCLSGNFIISRLVGEQPDRSDSWFWRQATCVHFNILLSVFASEVISSTFKRSPSKSLSTYSWKCKKKKYEQICQNIEIVKEEEI